MARAKTPKSKRPARPRKVSKTASKGDSGGRRRPKQDRSKALVDAILTATAQLLRDADSDQVTTNKIAVRAGVSVGSLYQYFPNKTALYTALAERHVANIEAQLMPMLEHFRGQPDLDLVRAIVEMIVTMETTDTRLQAELSRLSLLHQTSEVFVDFRHRAEELLAQVLRERAEDLPHPIEEPELSARILVRAIGGVLGTQLYEDPKGLDDPALVAELTRLAAAYLGF